MIIWINGCFGIGKTETAKVLHKKLKNSILYDPENIGVFLYDNMPYKVDDFQDYPLWRKLNYQIIEDLSFQYKFIIVPMTLTNIEYYNEIIGKLKKNNISVKHFILTGNKDTIIQRLDKRKNSTTWAYKQVDRCLYCFNTVITHEKIVTDEKTINEIAEEIIFKTFL